MANNSQTDRNDELLGREFYLADAVTVARSLLGKRLVHLSREGTTAGIIVETEAYAGCEDAACHSYQRKAPVGNHRTNIMFNEGGYAYVYLIYGMYNCFNVVVNEAGHPEAVLIRALEPVEGLPLMAKRRGIDISPGRCGDLKKLCNGPGKLCIAMGLTRGHDGWNLCRNADVGGIIITEGISVADPDIAATPRINVDYAGEASAWPYRFVIRKSAFLSTRKFIPTDERYCEKTQNHDQSLLCPAKHKIVAFQ
ncbi:MAG: DNA-3-methyladenine glycosylase [Planctomycetaceae bacterium]|nr:DNA-3-methyladenine glycosylase [Planctomycetaceae bacterium]